MLGLVGGGGCSVVSPSLSRLRRSSSRLHSLPMLRMPLGPGSPRVRCSMHGDFGRLQVQVVSPSSPGPRPWRTATGAPLYAFSLLARCSLGYPMRAFMRSRWYSHQVAQVLELSHRR